MANRDGKWMNVGRTEHIVRQLALIVSVLAEFNPWQPYYVEGEPFGYRCVFCDHDAYFEDEKAHMADCLYVRACLMMTPEISSHSRIR